MIQILIDIFKGYLLIGLLATVGWLIHGLFIYKGDSPHPAKNPDIVLVATLGVVIAFLWLPALVSAICVKWQHWKYGDFTGDSYLPGEDYRTGRVKDEHEDGPGF